MQFIQPQQIAGQIITLIDEADKEVVLVTPYSKIGEWRKLLNALKRVRSKGIPLKYYLRSDQFEAMVALRSLNIEPILMKGVHAKLYFNEKYAIVSSMNLMEISDSDSIDFAYKTETPKEYEDVVQFFNRYIKPASLSNPKLKPTLQKFDLIEFLFDGFQEHFKSLILDCHDVGEKVRFELGNRSIDFSIIRCNGSYEVLEISSILTGELFDHLSPHESDLQVETKSDITFIRGSERHYSYLRFTIPLRGNPTVEHEFVSEGRRCLSIILSVYASLREKLRGAENKNLYKYFY
jgi:hypothetical protein